MESAWFELAPVQPASIIAIRRQVKWLKIGLPLRYNSAEVVAHLLPQKSNPKEPS